MFPCFSTQPSMPQKLPPGAELYAGFLILPDNAPIPGFVQGPMLGMPHICGVSDIPATAVQQDIASPDELQSLTNLPIFVLPSKPKDIQFSRAYTLRYPTGEVFICTLIFESVSNNLTVAILIQPDFSRPYPVRRIDTVGDNGSVVTIEKVNFLPSKGILITRNL